MSCPMAGRITSTFASQPARGRLVAARRSRTAVVARTSRATRSKSAATGAGPRSPVRRPRHERLPLESGREVRCRQPLAAEAHKEHQNEGGGMGPGRPRGPPAVSRAPQRNGVVHGPPAGVGGAIHRLPPVGQRVIASPWAWLHAGGPGGPVQVGRCLRSGAPCLALALPRASRRCDPTPRRDAHPHSIAWIREPSKQAVCPAGRPGPRPTAGGGGRTEDREPGPGDGNSRRRCRSPDIPRCLFLPPSFPPVRMGPKGSRRSATEPDSFAERLSDAGRGGRAGHRRGCWTTSELNVEHRAILSPRLSAVKPNKC